MLVKEAMNRNVKTVRPNNTVKEAAIQMNQNRVGSLVVLTGSGQVVGILTERDILVKIVAAGKEADKISVQDVMTKKLITIEPFRTLEDAADVMTKNGIKKLPVVDKGRLVGIITATDLIAYERSLIENIASLIVRGRQEQPTFGG